MRIFLSHKQEDSTQALLIAARLKQKGLDYYVDVLDDEIEKDPARLTKHLLDQLRESTHLMAILSSKTQLSWWVPFEIGVATDCGNPIASYLTSPVDPPQYLRVWPFLKSPTDLDHYISVLTSRQNLSESYMTKTAADRRAEAELFHKQLRMQLGQMPQPTAGTIRR